ncbi:hypothetical protein O3M35_004473 [Rhynocoris fuscipes]|uniref:PID domain-containing protein n=1 Tax=Rhynocoris fuscipes TaxID=488301 RepID=A0AAW1CFR7_9HEMI
MASRMNATPICRCRVLYLGSAVPHITKDGLQGIQEPLRELYPEQGALGARGIDSWLSVWSNGILLENVDENHKKVTRFFPIDSLHYCAAVRYVLVPEKTPSSSASQPRFLPLDSPFARSPNPQHPPLFACILRRTTGIKVLECHSFICKREMAANALVRCCFHAYADSSYAKHMEPGTQYNTIKDTEKEWQGQSGSTLTLDSSVHNYAINELSRSIDDITEYNGDENHKIWAGSNIRESDEDAVYGEYACSTIKSARSNRPRQIMSATPPPLPPIKETKKKDKKKKDINRNTGTLRSTMIQVPQQLHGPYPMMVVPAATMPHLRRPLPQPRLRPTPQLLLQGKKYPITMEEPIYMPSNRPLSPISSYQPCQFPIEAYLMQHYATMNYNRKKNKKKHYKNDEYDINHYEPRQNKRDDKDDYNKNNNNNNNDDDESPYNTGICKRKGHMNERAFSYSIRQEHRSRSYGSLANLKFAPLPTVPAIDQIEVNKDEIKKEREIMQMMQDLDLSGDDIERSEVPANVYQQTRQRASAHLLARR